MKKYLFFFLCAMQGSFCMYAQAILNPDFSINQGNNIQECNPSFPTFSDGSVPGWHRTHGQAAFDDFCGTDHVIRLMSCFDFGTNVSSGEGIAANYTFAAGKTYFIWVTSCYSRDIQFCDNTLINIGAFNIHAVQNLPQGFCNLSPPVQFPLGGFDLLPTNTGTDEFIFSNHVFTGQKAIAYHPSHSGLKYIWLFPQELGIGNPQPSPNDYCARQALMMLESVHVIRTKCEDDVDLTISDNKEGDPFWGNSFLRPDPDNGTFFVGHGTIQAGSNLGSTATLVNPDPNANTTFEATGQVILSDNFSAIVNKTGAFIAEIGYCGNKPPGAHGDNDFPPPTGGKPGRINKNNNPYADISDPSATNAAITYSTEIPNTSDNYFSGFKVSPNPTTSYANFMPMGNIRYPVTLNVKDVSGRILNSQQYSNDIRVDLSTYSPGLYIIDIQTSSGVFTYKVTKY